MIKYSRCVTEWSTLTCANPEIQTPPYTRHIPNFKLGAIACRLLCVGRGLVCAPICRPTSDATSTEYVKSMRNDIEFNEFVGKTKTKYRKINHTDKQPRKYEKILQSPTFYVTQFSNKLHACNANDKAVSAVILFNFQRRWNPPQTILWHAINDIRWLYELVRT